MRKSTVVLCFLVAVSVPVLAGNAGLSADAIVSEIEKAQNVERIDQINPDKVSDPLLAELGEAVMDQAIPNQRQHELMDQMMGGEDSPSLQAMHRAMGYTYLASGGAKPWRSGWGIIGPGNRGPWMMGGWNSLGGHLMAASPLVWVLIVVLVVVIVVLASLLATRGGRGMGSRRPSNDLREILSQRYARGDFSRNEYQQMLKDLE